MTLNSTYSPLALSPRVLIYDRLGNLDYTFESKVLYPAGTRDFNLTGFDLKVGVNDNYGSLILTISDNDNALIDSTIATKPSLIEREGSVQFYLGKAVATISRWFYGKIKDVYVDRTSTGETNIIVVCVGWGVVLKERITKLVRNQAKTSDGETLDDTDTNTTIYNLILDLFTDKDHYIDENIPILANISTSGVCSECLSTKIANMNLQPGVSFAEALSTLSSIGKATWFVDYDRVLNIEDPYTHDSGMLFTNDLEAFKTLNWDGTKLGYVKNAPITWLDSSAESYYSMIHGVGHFNPSLSVSDGQTPDATDNLDTTWDAIPFPTTTDNIYKIAVRLTKTGTPANEHNIQIWGDTGGSGPDESDVRRTIKIAKEKLQGLGTTTPASWFEISIKPKLQITSGEILYLVVPKYGTPTNTINIDYKSATGTYWDSTDGITWTSRVGTMAHRIYEAKRMITTFENTETAKRLSEPREKIFPIRSDLEEQTVRQLMISAGESLTKQRRMYENIVITPTTSRIPLNKYCVINDITTGLEFRAVIIGYSISAHSSSDDDRLGANTISLTLDDFTYT
jgi:hypothetical protein